MTDVSPETVALEAPAQIKVGRQSIKVYIRGASRFVPVTFGKMSHVAVAKHAIAVGASIADGDFELVDRAGDGVSDVVGATAIVAIASGSIITAKTVAMPPPLARGTTVGIEVHAGRVKITGTGTLELAARPGQVAEVRLATGKLVRGTLLASKVVVIGSAP